MANQLLWGTNTSKVANSWRLAARIDKISNRLKSNRAVSFTHVKQESNKVADLLAIFGADNTNTLTHGPLSIIHE